MRTFESALLLAQVLGGRLGKVEEPELGFGLPAEDLHPRAEDSGLDLVEPVTRSQKSAHRDFTE
jgi:hypothetical protein